MLKYIILFIAIFFGISAALAQGQPVSPALIRQVQSQFGGQVVGVYDRPDGYTADIQVLHKNGAIVVVTIDKTTNQIINVKQ